MKLLREYHCDAENLRVILIMVISAESKGTKESSGTDCYFSKENVVHINEGTRTVQEISNHTQLWNHKLKKYNC